MGGGENRFIDLDAHHVGTTALPHPLLDRLQQVARFWISLPVSRVTWKGCASGISMPGERCSVLPGWP